MKTLYHMSCSESQQAASCKFCQPMQPFRREPSDLVLSALCLFFWSPCILSQHWPEEQNRKNKRVCVCLQKCVCAEMCVCNARVCQDRKRMSGYYGSAEPSSSMTGRQQKSRHTRSNAATPKFFQVLEIKGKRRILGRSASLALSHWKETHYFYSKHFISIF